MLMNCVEVSTNPSRSCNVHESSEKKLLMNEWVNVIFHLFSQIDPFHVVRVDSNDLQLFHIRSTVYILFSVILE